MISIDAALGALDDGVGTLPMIDVDLNEALGRTLAEPVRARVDLPPFAQSAMDGFALRGADLDHGEGKLQLGAHIAAGETGALEPLAAGHCARVFTGGRLPPNADTVALQEDANSAGDEIRFSARPAPGANIRVQGEECIAGAQLLDAGRRLDSQNLALAAMAGVGQLHVHRAPRIELFTSGDELVPPGRPLAPGQVYESNGSFLQAWLVERQCQARLRHLPDDEAVSRRALTDSEADLLLFTGGASVGDHDHGRSAALAAGFEEHFWKVAQKPGKPLWFGTRGQQTLLILPGNPGSVFVCTQLYVQRALDRLAGRRPAGPRWHYGRLRNGVQGDARRDRLLRAQRDIDDAGQVVLETLPRQASHMLSNLARTQALIRVPAGADLAPGALVDFIDTRP